MYHYTDCGLNYVYLKNGVDEKETPYGKGISIHNLEDLHRVIALDIAENRPELTSDEFRFLRKELELTQTTLGEMVGRDAQSVAKWEKDGEKGHKIPAAAANILRAIYLERARGNAHLEDLINRINDLDRKIHEQKLLLEEVGDEWQPAA